MPANDREILFDLELWLTVRSRAHTEEITASELVRRACRRFLASIEAGEVRLIDGPSAAVEGKGAKGKEITFDPRLWMRLREVAWEATKVGTVAFSTSEVIRRACRRYVDAAEAAERNDPVVEQTSRVKVRLAAN